MFPPIYKLYEWLDDDKMFCYYLSKNCKTVGPLLQYGNIIDRQVLSRNPDAVYYLNSHAIKFIENNLNNQYIDVWENPHFIHILEKNLDKVNWSYLSRNPAAIHILENNLDKVDWGQLSANPNAIHILENNFDKINWYNLSANPKAIHIIQNNLYKVEWTQLSVNPGAIQIIEQYLDLIDWYYLSLNPAAIHIIEKNLHRIDWSNLSKNPAAINILKYNLDKIDYDMLSENPAIFVLDPKAMRQQIMNFGKSNNYHGFAEELISKVLHPSKFKNQINKYNYDISIEEYLD